MDGCSDVLYKSNMADQALIPNFNLFGETGDLPDVVHCETIEARSRLHDWVFVPHRHARLHQVLLLKSGGGEASFEGREQRLDPMALVNVPMGCVHGYTFVPGTVGLVVTLAAETLDASLRPGEGLGRVLANVAVIRATPECVATLEHIADIHAGREFGRAQLLRSMAGLLLGYVARALYGSDAARAGPVTPGVLARFQALLELHYPEHWSVGRYARELNVSPTHLSRLARAGTGRPVTKLIRERLIREARRNLVYTNLPVSTIAFTLGFADAAYFSRVFARETGLAPSAFRARAAGRA